MTLITGTIKDISGVPDLTPWVFSSVLRENNAGTEVVTTKRVPVTPAAGGILSKDLDPGYARVDYKGEAWGVTVPATGPVDIWDLVAAAIAIPPGTSAATVAAAITAYLTQNPVTSLAYGPFSGVTTRLNHNRSTVIQALGDSTVYGNGAAGLGGWVGRLGLALGERYDASVWQCYWNGAIDAYDPPVVMRTSTLGARVANAGGAPVQYTAPSITGDFQIIAAITPTDWTAFGTIVSKWDASAGFGLFLNGGSLQLQVSSDGSATRFFNGTATVSFTANQKRWVRADFDLNNGSGGSTVRFYTSTDGATWTQLGADVTQAGTTATFDNTADPYYLGALTSGHSFPLIGTISWIQVRNALANGKDVVPQLPEMWDLPGQVDGGPVILLMNGGQPGAILTYLDDTTRRPKLLTAPLPDVIMLAEGFNETMPASQFVADYLTWVNHIKSDRPNVPIVVTTQNRWIAPKLIGNIQQMAEYEARNAVAMAAQPGVTVLDTAEAFVGNAALIGSDGEHPTTAGYQAEADWLLRRLDPA